MTFLQKVIILGTLLAGMALAGAGVFLIAVTLERQELEVAQIIETQAADASRLEQQEHEVAQLVDERDALVAETKAELNQAVIDEMLAMIEACELQTRQDCKVFFMPEAGMVDAELIYFSFIREVKI